MENITTPWIGLFQIPYLDKYASFQFHALYGRFQGKLTYLLMNYTELSYKNIL